jgi:general nucleoside transport system permease protein
MSRRPAPLQRLVALATRPGSLRIVFALAGALLVFDLVAFGFGQAPHDMLRQAFLGTWGTPYGIGQVLFKSTPLIMTGLAFHIGLRAGLFNIGTEGQLALASLLGAWVATKLPASWPALLALPVALAAALAVGAAWAAIAGVMRARLGVHEIISGIMLNRSADVLLPYVLVAWLGSSSLRTADVVPGSTLPRLDRWIPGFNGSAASLAFPLAVLAAFAVYAWLERSRAGREMRWIGLGAEACAAQGISVRWRQIQAMLLSGAMAAAAMAGTVLGYKGYYELGLGAGTGFTGIAVAMLGRGGPIGLVASALVFGTVAQAGLAINAEVPKEAMGVLEALVIILVAVAATRGRATPAPAFDATEAGPMGPDGEHAPDRGPTPTEPSVEAPC